MDKLARVAEVMPSASAPSSTVKMRTEGLSKHYGETVALHPMDLSVRTGELLTLLGPSGSGKTTLLQIVCGLVEPTAGKLFIDAKDRTHALVHERDIGVVFQNYALFGHLTVFENIAFPLQMRRVGAQEVKRRVMHALEMVRLATFGERFPRELSGGQQQRVALARALVYQPSLILMDGSLSALDRKLRENMQMEIKRIHRETGATIIFVTHDQEEALALSDRVCLMNAGRIEQIGTPQAIYETPRSAFVADFIDVSNKLRGRADRDSMLVTPDGAIPLSRDAATSAAATSAEAMLIVRPEHIRIDDGVNGFVRGRVIERIYGGSETRLIVELPSGALLTVRQMAGTTVRDIGDVVSLRWQPEHALLLDH
ncbi:ABC transporter ATP-binding protein [Candidatus Burkholderia verschuerenii]|uniref:ABC transporter ATP-binding protein n=1 Tax=Candidatus Burkholderia verschuerenii TaxID=242163 RepID=UPI000A41C8D1|nr:ABC transporter ATP-binding protein [Candidatus Burkholderia verschuerenii]